MFIVLMMFALHEHRLDPSKIKGHNNILIILTCFHPIKNAGFVLIFLKSCPNETEVGLRNVGASFQEDKSRERKIYGLTRQTQAPRSGPMEQMH